MSRLLKKLPEDVRELIREYSSDKTLHRKHEADLISALAFYTNDPPSYFDQLFGRGLYTAATTPPTVYFKSVDFANMRTRVRTLRFRHNQFDERNFPQHFDIGVVWDNLHQQDAIEAMNREDRWLFPDGMPESDQIHGYGWLNH